MRLFYLTNWWRDNHDQECEWKYMQWFIPERHHKTAKIYYKYLGFSHDILISSRGKHTSFMAIIAQMLVVMNNQQEKTLSSYAKEIFAAGLPDNAWPTFYNAITWLTSSPCVLATCENSWSFCDKFCFASDSVAPPVRGPEVRASSGLRLWSAAIAAVLLKAPWAVLLLLLLLLVVVLVLWRRWSLDVEGDVEDDGTCCG